MVEFGSLFAGVGGFDLGFERAGMTCAWQGEIDVRCNEVLAHHWPDVRRYGDVRDVGKHNLGSVGLICGGFPCQGLSVAGRRAGLADERSGLWWEFARIIEELRPRWVVIENVPGLLSSNGGRDMGAIIGTLAELGYGWAYRSLDAQFYGVAQRRRRVFIVGCLGDRTSAAKVLFEPESLRRDSAPRREAGAKVARDIAACLNSGGNDGGFRTEPGEHVIVQHALSGHNQRNDPDGEYFVVTGPLCSHSKRHGHAMTTQQAAEAGHLVFDWQSGGDVRLNISEKHTSALQASQVPAVQNRYGVRRLTVTECEALQGFPRGWTAVNGMKDTPRYRMLGNAVCVPVAGWIGGRILAVTDDH